MKQGRASHDGKAGTKVEPSSCSKNPAAVAQLGVMLGNHAMNDGRILPGASVPLYRGRGLEAPMVSKTIHNRGSQGRR